jgi:hypothetical protein
LLDLGILSQLLIHPLLLMHRTAYLLVRFVI